jgi:hypothetical protein
MSKPKNAPALRRIPVVIDPDEHQCLSKLRSKLEQERGKGVSIAQIVREGLALLYRLHKIV